MRFSVLVALTLALPLLTAGLGAAQTSGDSSKAADTEKATTQSAPDAKTDVKAEVEGVAESGGNPVVLFETNYGNIKVELFKDKAPISAENLLSYVRDGFYDGTVFHRVVKGFVIQAGGWTEDLDQKETKAPIKNEATNGLSNLRGTLSVARTSDINSGTTHFFINLVDNKRLDHTGETAAQYGYAVFGKVIEGMDVVDKIAQVPVTTRGGSRDVPVKPVVITKARMAAAEKPAGEKQSAADKPAEEKPKALEQKPVEKQIGDPETGGTGK
jgi:cyclophilin family peptidyl-prolyl cis-trans isomerase